MENQLEINVMDMLSKMKVRVAEDAQKIAMLEVTVDMYIAKIKEMEKQIAMYQEMQNQ